MADWNDKWGVARPARVKRLVGAGLLFLSGWLLSGVVSTVPFLPGAAYERHESMVVPGDVISAPDPFSVLVSDAHAADGFASIIAPALDTRDSSLRELYAAFPSLEAALSTLTWPPRDGGRTDAAAARLLSLVGAITRGYQYHRSHYAARGALQRLYSQVWSTDRVLVSASACAYCGLQGDVIKGLVRSGSGTREEMQRIARANARLFAVASERSWISSTWSAEAARVYAYLDTAGDSKTAKAIGKILAQSSDWRALELWSRGGTNGPVSLTVLRDLDRIDRDTVIRAWESGVKDGYSYATVDLTEYLLSSGYRPALRWLLWVLDGSASYISLDEPSNEHFGDRYVAMADRYLDFPARPGAQVGRFYSRNWLRIHWDEEYASWRLSR